MNKHIILPLFLIMAFMTQIPAATAWNPDTHHEIVESNYYSLPVDIQQNLDLNAMKDGSDDPDFKFFDFKYHSYPNSYAKASYWLNEGQNHYKNGDYKYASYCYGVASHYISDSFVAPHAAGISGANHSLYEMRASLLNPEKIPSTGDLNSTLYNGDLNGKESWNNWIKTKNTSYIQNDLNHATSASYNAIDSSLSGSYFNYEKDDDFETGSGILMLLSSLI